MKETLEQMNSGKSPEELGWWKMKIRNYSAIEELFRNSKHFPPDGVLDNYKKILMGHTPDELERLHREIPDGEVIAQILEEKKRPETLAA